MLLANFLFYDDNATFFNLFLFINFGFNGNNLLVMKILFTTLILSFVFYSCEEENDCGKTETVCFDGHCIERPVEGSFGDCYDDY